MIDRISGRRLLADFPVRSAADTCYAYGQNPSMLSDRFHKAHDLILRASTNKDTFAFNGLHNQQHSPRPLGFGNMNEGLTHYNAKLFAEKAQPKLAALFRPMTTALRAAVPAYLAAE